LSFGEYGVAAIKFALLPATIAGCGLSRSRS
jgi:hypothetical protein